MSSEDQMSDEEVFIGDITMKEIKKRLNPANYRRTIGYAHVKEDSNCSLKIIETHSAPNMLPRIDLTLSPTITKSESSPGLSPEVVSDWDIKPDDTFLKLERMVSDLSVSPQLQDSNIDSTSDSKGYFFMGQPQLELPVNLKLAELKQEINSPTKNSNETSDIKISQLHYDISPKSKSPQLKTPMKTNTPASPATPTNIFRTPLNDFKRTPIFKTPGNPVSQRKNGRFTPSKKYQNVTSPVAAYIKQCPLVPLVKDVCPKKPLPGMSSIPKLMKSKPNSSSKENLKQEHKENVKPEIKSCSKLPSVAYRSAKETKLIKIPDDEKMPQNQWAKEVASSIPRAMIIKHGIREVTSKKALQQTQEDSFGDLSLHQADLSICTQKSAFNKPKKIM